MLRYYGNKSLRLIPNAMARVRGGAQPAALFAAPSGPVGTARVHNVALGASGAAGFFLDPALLEEAGAHGMASGTQI